MADRVAPKEAFERVERLRATFGEADVELVWHKEADESISYDLLLREPDGTWSVALSPADSLPWPLRGARRWDDRELLRVGDVVLRVDEALARLDILYDARQLATLIDQAIVKSALEPHESPVTEGDLQAASDAFRRSRGLHSVAATKAWLAARNLTEEAFEEQLSTLVRARRLRERIARERMRHLNPSSSAFDLLRVLCVEADARLSPSLSKHLHDDLAAALASAPDAATIRGVLRRDARDQLGFDLERATVGDVVEAQQPGRLCRVLRIDAADSDVARNAIADALFRDWLHERRRDVEIEWNWGTTDVTGAARIVRAEAPCGDC